MIFWHLLVLGEDHDEDQESCLVKLQFLAGLETFWKELLEPCLFG